MIVVYRKGKSYDAIINNSGPNHPIIVSYFDLYNLNFLPNLQFHKQPSVVCKNSLGLQFSFLSDGFKLNFWLFLCKMTVHPVRLEE